MDPGKPITALLLSLLLGCSPASSSSNAKNTDLIKSHPTTPEASALCPANTGGVMVGHTKRFLLGMNYVWQDFGADFGGIANWGQGGVTSRTIEHAHNLALMRKRGPGVVRWWMMPDLRGDGVVFDGRDKPLGLGGTISEDLEEALRLAEEQDINLMLCLFSFDAFFSTNEVGGQKIRSLAPVVRDASSRRQLIQNVIRPLAKLVQRSAYAQRMIAWDVINEPEWAMMGSNPYGDANYDPISGIEAVTHQEMETFVREVTLALHEESSALVTVGSAAVKWAHAWQSVGIDFYQPHVYDWSDQYWPYDHRPAKYDLADKPVVIGEFPVEGLTRASLGKMLETLYEVGYAGAMPWDFRSAKPEDFTTLATFAVNHQCGGITTTNLLAPKNCRDAAPDNVYTCEQQAGWGKCSEPWMQGFCLKSCGQCT